MNIIITLFVLFFSSSVFSNNISDFQINGMSLGENLLDYFSKEDINDNLRKDSYTYVTKEKNKYVHTQFFEIPNLQKYDALQISYKEINIGYFKIVMIGGMIPFKDMELCYKKQKEIDSEVNLLIKNNFKNENYFTNERGSTNRIQYNLKKGKIEIDCVNWNDDIPWLDHLRVTISSDEFEKWIKG